MFVCKAPVGGTDKLSSEVGSGGGATRLMYQGVNTRITAIKAKAKMVIDQYDTLKAQRSSWEDHWQDIADYFTFCLTPNTIYLLLTMGCQCRWLSDASHWPPTVSGDSEYSDWGHFMYSILY